MIKTISKNEFCQAFKDMNRESNFSWDAREAIFDHLESLENDMDKQTEMDVIAVCCEWSEYASLEEFQADYSTDYESIEDIERETIVLRLGEVDGKEAFVIQQF